jgi:putative signaling protein
VFELKTSYVFFGTDTDALQIVYCEQYPQAKGMTLEEFMREYFSSPVTGEMEADFDCEALVEFLRRKNNGRTVSFSSRDGKYSYRFTAYSHPNEEGIVYCSVNKIEGKDFNGDYARDYLTGVYTRSYLIDGIEKQLSEGAEGALILVDLDDFKKINDTLGHAVGDECLSRISAGLGEACEGELLGRYGGDEFLVWVKAPDGEKIERICKKILAIRYTVVQRKTKKQLTVMCSCGVSFAPKDGKNFLQLFDKADKALYRVKNSGKHGVCVYGLRVEAEHGGEKLAVSKTDKNQKLFRGELRQLKIRSMCLAAIFLAVVVCTALIFGVQYSNSMSGFVYAEAQSIMSNFCERISADISGNLDSWFSQLKMAGQVIGNSGGAVAPIETYKEDPLTDTQEYHPDDEFDYSFLDGTLTGLADTMSFSSVGVLFESGNLYFSSDVQYNIASEDVAGAIISEGEQQFVGNIHINLWGERIIFAVPYYRKAELPEDTDRIAGIVGLMEPEKLAGLLETSAFENEAYLLLVRSDGTKVVSGKHGDFDFPYNIFNAFEMMTDEDSLLRVAEDFLTGAKDTVEFHYGGNSFLTYYTPVEGVASEASPAADWRIVIMVPTSVVARDILAAFKGVQTTLFALLAIICIILIFVIAVYGRIIRKNKLLKYTDPVTGNINQERFRIDAGRLLHDGNGRYAIVSMNILRFKYVNEQVGREVADEILADVLRVTASFLREDELTARGYADRFLILLRSDVDDLSRRLQELYKKLSETSYARGAVSLKFTMGVYEMPDASEIGLSSGIDRARLAQRYTEELYRGKSIVLFDDNMLVKEMEEADLEQREEQALAKGQFVVYYQLKRNILRDEWCGSEALVRWMDPVRGMISPGKFIPLFERNGFIVELDKYVFEQVCKDLRRSLDAGTSVVPVSVNLSKRHFSQEYFLDEFEKIMDRYRVPHKYIEFEITESLVMEREEFLKKFIDRIHKIGCTCSIDDFGSGYSSLNMLKEFNFDTIKLDRKFFYGEKGFDDESKHIVSTLISLSHDLGKNVVSEGIETQEQVQFLRDRRCDMIQGFYYSRPMPKEDYWKRLTETEGEKSKK